MTMAEHRFARPLQPVMAHAVIDALNQHRIEGRRLYVDVQRGSPSPFQGYLGELGF